MALVLRRKFKIKEQLLIMILPFIAIPLILILSARIYLYNFIKDNKDEINTSLISQNSKIINYDLAKEDSSSYGFTEIKNSVLTEDGIIFVFNINNKMLYSNFDSRILIDKFDINVTSLINTDEIQSILKSSYAESKVVALKNDCLIFNFKIENIKYQGYYLNTILADRLADGVKLLYFYPKNKFIDPIYPVIFFILIISLIVFVIVIYIFYKLSEIYTYPLNNLEYIIKRASQGYLNFDIISESNDELGQLYKNFTEMIKFNKSIFVEIVGSSNNLMGYHKSLEKSISDFNERLKNQNSMVTDNIKLIEEFDDLINKKIQHIKNVRGIIENAQVQSDDSTELIHEMINDINNIAQTGQQINYVAELLNKISEKTRLLSVNSAIEASRAGDVGKGFGVVATEIRKLAVIAKDSAQEIGELVKVNESRIISGINKTNEVLNSLKNMNSGIKMINQIIEQIYVTSQDEKKNSQLVVSTENNISNEMSANMNFLESIEKIKNLFKMDLEKIKNAIKKIIFDIREKVTIRDVKLYSEQKKERTEKLKLKRDKKEEQKFIKEPISKKYLRKTKIRKSNKLNTVRAVTLYKPKKSILDKFIK